MLGGSLTFWLPRASQSERASVYGGPGAATGSESHLLGRGCNPQPERPGQLPAPQGSQQPWVAGAREASSHSQSSVPCHDLLPASLQLPFKQYFQILLNCLIASPRVTIHGAERQLKYTLLKRKLTQHIHCFCPMSKAGGREFFLFIDSMTSKFSIGFTDFLNLFHQRLYFCKVLADSLLFSSRRGLFTTLPKKFKAFQIIRLKTYILLLISALYLVDIFN